MYSDFKQLPRVVADGPLAPGIEELLAGKVDLLPWSVLNGDADRLIKGIYTYGHPALDGPMMDRAPNLRVISNYGVGVDHICLAAAFERQIPVGNTPGVLDGATADMGFCLLMATARRLAEGDRYARGSGFTTYDPGFMLGREIHGSTLGILGMGRIGAEVARRARGFNMRVIYHNRNRREAIENEIGACYVSFEELLRDADHVVICLPLNDHTRRLLGATELGLMKSTATLINIARGAIIDTDALVCGSKNAASMVRDSMLRSQNHCRVTIRCCDWTTL